MNSVRAALGAVVVATLVASVVVIATVAWPPAHRAFAYLTDHDLVVATVSGEIARTPAVSAAGGNVTSTTWTSDGRYAVVVEDGAGGPDDTAHRNVVTVDSWSGRIARYPCPDCTTVVPVGGSSVQAAQASDHTAASAPFAGTIRFDLAAGTDGVVDRTFIRDQTVDHLFLVAGLPGQAFAIGQVGPRGLETGFVLDADGTGSQLGVHRLRGVGGSDQRGIGKATARTDPTGTVLAVSGQYFNSRRPDCSVAGEIYLFHLGNGYASDTDLRSAVPAGQTPGIDVNLGIDDLWWAEDGRLHAILSTQPCGTGTGDAPAVWTQWVLNGDRWGKDGTEQVMSDRTLDPGDQLLLRPHDTTESGAGRLVAVHDGDEQPVDDGVLTQSVSVSQDPTADPAIEQSP